MSSSDDWEKIDTVRGRTRTVDIFRKDFGFLGGGIKFSAVVRDTEKQIYLGRDQRDAYNEAEIYVDD